MVDLTINGGSQTLDGTYTYDNVSITNGGILYITPYDGTGTTGRLILNANTVTVDATSSIVGYARGYRGGWCAYCGGGGWGGSGNGEGPGGGIVGQGDQNIMCESANGGGGGYGTAGIKGPDYPNSEIGYLTGGNGGPAYGTNNLTTIEMGSGGGGGDNADGSTCGGNGGAALTINATSITIRGQLNFDGGPAIGDYVGSVSGGGGAGGGILLYITGAADLASSNIHAIGGVIPAHSKSYMSLPQTDSGGGGRIKVFSVSRNTTGATITAGTVYYEIISAPTTGNASFTSNPSGARIWIDGVDKGINTPSTISDLTPGSHNYTLKLTGYLDASGSFSVTAGQTTTVPLVTLTPATGGASFTSNPSGARIWIDAIDKGVDTPNTISGLSAGNHNYTLKLTGYQDTGGSFSVTAGQTTTVPLVTFPASAYFTSIPTGATVWIDDTNLGTTTPATVVGLTAGSHSYRLIKIGYTNRGNFSTTAGQTTNVSATLTAVGLNGSIWIEDQYLCYINANNVVTYVSGTSSGAVAGLPGSTWIEGTQLAYIDSSGNKRLLPVTTLGAVTGLNGSLWIDGNYLYYIASGIQRYVTI